MRVRIQPPRGPGRSVEGAGVAWRQRGESLVQVVIAAALVGIAFVALLNGFATLTLSAARHNEVVLLEAELSRARQSVVTATFTPVPLATCGPVYPMPTPSATGVTFQQCVTPTAAPLTLQQVTIQATGRTSTRAAVIFKGPREPP